AAAGRPPRPIAPSDAEARPGASGRPRPGDRFAGPPPKAAPPQPNCHLSIRPARGETSPRLSIEFPRDYEAATAETTGSKNRPKPGQANPIPQSVTTARSALSKSASKRPPGLPATQSRSQPPAPRACLRTKAALAPAKPA